MKKLLILLLAPLFSIAQPCDALYPPSNAKRVATPMVSVIPDSSAWLGIYYECDYAMYQNCGNDTNEVKRRMLGIFNGVRQLKAKAGIRTYISGYRLWTTPDPYESAMSASHGVILFGQRMDSLNLPHDLYQCLSMHCLGCGGAAYVNTLAYQPYYRVSFCGIATGYVNNGLLYPIPWNIYVSTHESGHSTACYHTHDPVWNGDGTMIDSCACAVNSGYCQSGATVGGGNEALPTGGGTVMGYCHALYNVGVNGNKGFGSQPSESLRYSVESANLGSILHNPLGSFLNYHPVIVVTSTTTTGNAEWYHPKATQYKYRYKVAGQVWNAATTTTLNNIFISGLQPNKWHYIQVKSRVGGVWSAWSTSYKFKTK